MKFVCKLSVRSQIESYTVEQKPEALHAWVAELQARFPQGRIALGWSSRAGR